MLEPRASEEINNMLSLSASAIANFQFSIFNSQCCATWARPCLQHILNPTLVAAGVNLPCLTVAQTGCLLYRRLAVGRHPDAGAFRNFSRSADNTGQTHLNAASTDSVDEVGQ